MDRRSFLKTSAIGGAAVAASSIIPACASSKDKDGKKAANDVALNISFQEGIAPGETLAEKLDFMQNLGVVGFEPSGRGLKGRVKEIQDALNGRNIKVSAICAGFSGFILAEDPAVKNEFDTTMREIVEAAGELGSTPRRPATICARSFTSSVSSPRAAARPSSLSHSTARRPISCASSLTPPLSPATLTAKV